MIPVDNVETSGQLVASNGNNETEGNEFGAIFVNGEYQPKAHFACEKRRFERDLTIPQIVDQVGEDACKFVEIRTSHSGTRIHLTYHPNPNADIGNDLEWVDVPAAVVKNAGRFYVEASNTKITWYYKALKGELFTLVNSTFEQDLINAEYNNNLKQFSKKVSRFILNHPHVDTKTYGTYIFQFKMLIEIMEPSISKIALDNIIRSIAMDLKNFVVDYKDKDLPEQEVYNKVIDASTRLTIQKCSKDVHYRLDQIDLNAQKAKAGLQALAQEAEKEREAERLEKEARLEEIKKRMANAKTARQNLIQKAEPKLLEAKDSTKKRKIEEIEENPESEKAAEMPSKKHKADESGNTNDDDDLFLS